MNLVMVSDVECGGGATVAAARLAEALADRDVSVTRVVAYECGDQHSWAIRKIAEPKIPQNRQFAGPLLRPIREHRQAQRTGASLRKVLCELAPDVINVHNIHAASQMGWSVELVRICARHAPTVWTLHDMWSFTGGCAYSGDCRQFIAGCTDRCPEREHYPASWETSICRGWKNRRRALRDSDELVAVTPSRWLATVALSGLWKDHQVEVVPNGIHINRYIPLDREQARKALGIQHSEVVMLMVATNLEQPHKGADHLVKALEGGPLPQITLLGMGAGKMPIDTERVRTVLLGHVEDEQRKILAYNAADILVHPATEDNFPNVILEAIACGTPVVGFPVGGVPEMVREGVTGWLASEPTPDALRAALERAWKDLQDGKDFRESCRSVAEAEYATDVQGRRYEDLFKSLL